VKTTTAYRMEGLTLTVADLGRSIEFYRDKLGLSLEWDALPHFALLRVPGPNGGTVGLLAWSEVEKEGAIAMNSAQARAFSAG
jgi:catechol 2,3-dioxygenase-like lactoylglutathione lyase family enzyme